MKFLKSTAAVLLCASATVLVAVTGDTIVTSKNQEGKLRYTLVQIAVTGDTIVTSKSQEGKIRYNRTNCCHG